MSEGSPKPPDEWIHYPVSDWTDYMDKGLTVYERDGALYELLTNRKIRDLSPEEIARRAKENENRTRGKEARAEKDSD